MFFYFLIRFQVRVQRETIWQVVRAEEEVKMTNVERCFGRFSHCFEELFQLPGRQFLLAIQFQQAEI